MTTRGWQPGCRRVPPSRWRNPMTLLAIDPDTTLLDLLAFALRRQGREVLTTTDGAVGLRLWQTKAPALVLVSADAATVTGWDVCARIRDAGATPVLLLAEHPTETEVIRGLE